MSHFFPVFASLMEVCCSFIFLDFGKHLYCHYFIIFFVVLAPIFLIVPAFLLKAHFFMIFSFSTFGVARDPSPSPFFWELQHALHFLQLCRMLLCDMVSKNDLENPSQHHRKILFIFLRKGRLTSFNFCSRCFMNIFFLHIGQLFHLFLLSKKKCDFH